MCIRFGCQLVLLCDQRACLHVLWFLWVSNGVVCCSSFNCTNNVFDYDSLLSGLAAYAVFVASSSSSSFFMGHAMVYHSRVLCFWLFLLVFFFGVVFGLLSRRSYFVLMIFHHIFCCLSRFLFFGFVLACCRHTYIYVCYCAMSHQQNIVNEKHRLFPRRRGGLSRFILNYYYYFRFVFSHSNKLAHEKK